MGGGTGQAVADRMELLKAPSAEGGARRSEAAGAAGRTVAKVEARIPKREKPSESEDASASGAEGRTGDTAVSPNGKDCAAGQVEVRARRGESGEAE